MGISVRNCRQFPSVKTSLSYPQLSPTQSVLYNTNMDNSYFFLRQTLKFPLNTGNSVSDVCLAFAFNFSHEPLALRHFLVLYLINIHKLY